MVLGLCLTAPRAGARPGDSESPPSGARPISPAALRTAHEVTSPLAPGLALVSIQTSTSWQGRRARIRDTRDGRVERYAIGDLLPHGALLVGISARSVDVMIADSEILRLRVERPLERLERFLYADGPVGGIFRLRPRRGFERRIARAVAALSDPNPKVVQAALTALSEAGEQALPALSPIVTSTQAVASAEYELVGLESQLKLRPRALGDLACGLLSVVSGAGLGDPSAPGLPAPARARLREDWRRWLDAED